ncbi:zinc finger protein OZF-like [Archocentrus centrarchus]|uniref:zinc finger protein OZF-like n=1 Tax=Archocentrus centrarchus TaxID=63155 RepID=UPI0011EA2688|nr:zinc finger protein OZF-like [Archocentrus centrarchus]
MPSVQYLREFINERLTAAAEEIFTEFEKTIVQYEEEIDRQRRLLDITWKPEIKLHRTDLPQQHMCKEEEEVITDQQLCNQKRHSSLDQEEPEPPQTKEEQEELCSIQEGEQFGLKEETDTFMVTSTYEENDHRPNREHLLSDSSAVAESQNPQVTKKVDSRSTGNRTQNRNNAEDPPMSETQCNSGKSKKFLKCDICGKAFKYNCQMKIHSRIHTGEKPFSCKMCGKMFICRSSLSKHTRAHTGEKPYLCTTCGKMFGYNSDLLSHMIIHTGEKPYPCKTCGKMFGYRSSLMKHLRSHTGVKPYHCQTCGKKFSRSCQLSEHTRIHTGEKPYRCKTCGKAFGRRSRLSEHIRTHTGEKPCC